MRLLRTFLLFRRTFLCIALTILSAAAVARAADTPAPHYRFAAGQEMVYEGTKRTWFEKKEPADLAVSWHVWVVAVDEKGRGDLVVEYCAKKEDTVKNRYLFRLNVGPHGSMTWNPTLGGLPAWFTARRIFPQLPTADELKAGSWQSTEARSGMKWDYRTDEKTDDDLLHLTAVCKGPIENVSVGSQQYTLEFDPSKGLLTSSDFGGFWKDYDEREEETIALVKVNEHDASWLGAFRDDADRYFHAMEDHRRLVGSHDLARLARAHADGGLVDRFAEARSLLTAAHAANRSEELAENYDEQLRQHDQHAAGFTGDNGARGRLHDVEKSIDRPSPAWAADDLEGTTHTLADYRGKVVVLDIWFRKCNYCVRAQPQFDAVVDEFKDKPVVFLGVNIDEEAADAEFAVTQLKISYPTLRGLDVKKLYPAAGAPTWIVIDPKGVVRAIHVGYSGLLEEELTDSINESLKAH